MSIAVQVALVMVVLLVLLLAAGVPIGVGIGLSSAVSMICMLPSVLMYNDQGSIYNKNKLPALQALVLYGICFNG